MILKLFADAIARVMTGTNTKESAVGAGLGIKIWTYTDNIKTKPALPQQLLVFQ